MHSEIAVRLGLEGQFYMGLPTENHAGSNGASSSGDAGGGSSGGSALWGKRKGKRLWGRGLAATDPAASGVLSELLPRYANPNHCYLDLNLNPFTCNSLTLNLHANSRSLPRPHSSLSPLSCTLALNFARRCATLSFPIFEQLASSGLGLQRGAADGDFADILKEQSAAAGFNGYSNGSSDGESMGDALDLASLGERIKGKEHLLDLR